MGGLGLEGIQPKKELTSNAPNAHAELMPTIKIFSWKRLMNLTKCKALKSFTANTFSVKSSGKLTLEH